MDGKQLKNSILQWAIQGKLVPQNPKDEPAQKLLERIAASRNGDVSPWSEAIGSSKNSKKSLSTSLRGPCKGTKQSKNQPSRIYRENGVWYEQIGTATPKDISDEIPFEIPENWALCRIKDICSKITDGTHHSPVNTPSGDYKYVTAKNIKDFGIQLSNISYVDKKIHEEIYARCNPNLGDILYIKDGATTGVCCINDLDEPFSLLSSVALLKPQKEIFAPYLLYCLRAPICYDSVRESMKGTGITRITLTKIEKWIIPLPPLAEQKRIVAKLEQVLPLAEEYGAAQEQLDKLNKELPEALKKSILQEAIQGKLVPQNPKDDPASVLLTKIRKEKETLVEQGKLKKKDLEIIPIDKNETPFEIPDSWTWCRIGDIFTLQAGKNIASNEIHNSMSKEYQYPCYGGNGKRGFVSTYNRKGHYCLIGRQGALCGNINYADGLFYATEHAVVVEVYSNVDVLWSGIFLSALNLNQYATATAQPGLAVANINKVLIPLPPLAEQKRIVKKIEELYKVIDSWH
ncbi:restriction endonuclease subunit S [Fibrobacter sp. UWB12]|uniref:restriction endonuclease subunit S n=1 Tax=Fibrobacter sp. UWB12 TaxID=1896203 RepID=UPI00091F927F|nr:restriction endonuclease subunit S [Fibrobacter sp. UWB12]SHK48949.1 type I restriction enzyme, S subunit [Fibrobacter sp. UWB12]